MSNPSSTRLLNSVTLSELKALAAEGKQKSPHLSTRIDRAVYLIVTRDFKVISPTESEIASDKPNKVYRVHFAMDKTRRCTCHDFGGASLHGAPTNWCKHLLAFYMIYKLEKIVAQRITATQERLISLEQRLSALEQAPAPRFAGVA